MKRANIRQLLTAVLLLLTGTSMVTAQDNAYTNGQNEQIIKSQQAFREKRFGIFIHWGLYSMVGQGEWVMQNQNISYQEYPKLAQAFYPANFDAAEWVRSFKQAGAKYICITTRHHDGFSLFDTDASDYNVVDATPFGRDIIGELAEECRKEGIALHFYYSTLDWGRADYPRGRTGRGTGRGPQEDPENYFNFMKSQLTELLTKYGDVGCIWFDGHWDHDEDTVDWTRDSVYRYWHYDEIYPLIHNLQSGCLIGNNHHLDPFEGENIQIFERDVPGQNTAGWHEGGISDLPLETCQTMNRSWGYRITDNNYKSFHALIKYLASTAGRDANLLLNVGPQPDGSLPEAALERLSQMGEWLQTNGETIYGTRATLVKPQPWGVVTHKENKMWLHIFPDELASAQTEGKIYIPYTTDRKIKSAKVFSSSAPLKFKQYKEGIFVFLPKGVETQNIPDYIVELTFNK